MKTFYVFRFIPFVVSVLLYTERAFGQIPQTIIRPILGQYTNSAPPLVVPGVQYRLDAVSPDGAIIDYAYQNCKFEWSITNGKDATNNTSTRSVLGTSKDVFVKWDNVDNFGRLKVVTTNLYGTPSQTCPLGNNQTREITVAIQYFADLEAIRLNGNPVTTTTLACNTNPITLSIPYPYTTNPYNPQLEYVWYITGGSITNGQNTNTIQVIPSLNQNMTVQVNVKRSDNPYITKTKTANLNRPTPKDPSVTNVGSVCLNQTVTATATAANATGYEWTSTGGVFVNGSQNTGVTGASVGVSGNASGTYSVRAYSSDCQSYSGPKVSSVYVGVPSNSTVTVDNNLVNPGPVGVLSNSTHYFSTQYPGGYVPSYSINATTNSGDIVLNLTGVNNGSGQINVSGSIGNAALHINAYNSCGSDSRDIIFYIPSSYRASPNPAKSTLNISFSDVSYEDGLPDQLDLISEKDQKSVRTANMKEEFKKQEFKKENKVVFDVSNLPRGTYYLRITNSRQAEDKKVETSRIILE